jgi:hypothetical protein
MLIALDSIYAAMEQFHGEVVRWHPPLLEEIFDVDTGDPETLFLPERLDVLQTFFEAVQWEAPAGQISQLASLPVRASLARGPVKDATLRRALLALRHYWVEVEGRSWTMYFLKDPTVRQSDDRRDLKGECEAFVSDLLLASGIRHDLQSLSSAWLAVDRERKLTS